MGTLTNLGRNLIFGSSQAGGVPGRNWGKLKFCCLLDAVSWLKLIFGYIYSTDKALLCVWALSDVRHSCQELFIQSEIWCSLFDTEQSWCLSCREWRTVCIIVCTIWDLNFVLHNCVCIFEKANCNAEPISCCPCSLCGNASGAVHALSGRSSGSGLLCQGLPPCRQLDQRPRSRSGRRAHAYPQWTAGDRDGGAVGLWSLHMHHLRQPQPLLQRHR